MEFFLKARTVKAESGSIYKLFQLFKAAVLIVFNTPLISAVREDTTPGF